ncbi:hypothetical protein PPTG_23263 [Phytophthora nicotianae INRA-310]|uniref:Uncharacterized protein n=1 Tax=Phytophthora nicotianae (strain INRA-310) TaxID=761204 RepID=W2Q0X3_PHYN3|nr:hypothetical protein PPTG_23263 [Phytophthora nicotianae INRA-310]ETN06762.1 hypothetical protein PPTG_23263 [Phytophthora nicotianae INRA-310]
MIVAIQEFIPLIRGLNRTLIENSPSQGLTQKWF